jgi:hypothetical protein
LLALEGINIRIACTKIETVFEAATDVDKIVEDHNSALEMLYPINEICHHP